MIYLFVLTFASNCFSREWLDVTGKHKIEADFVVLENDVVTLRKPDKSEIKLAIDKLSDHDQSYVRFLASDGLKLLEAIQSDDQTIRRKAAVKLEAMLLPLEAIAPILKYLELEIATTQSVNQERSTEPLKEMPLVGDETSLVRIEADPQSFIDKGINITGVISPSSYYNYGYDDAESTHYSFDFRETNRSLEIIGDATVYASKEFSAILLERATSARETGASGAVVRLKVVLKSDRYSGAGSWDLLEANDWQFYDVKKGSWSSWTLEGLELGLRCISKVGDVDPVIKLLTSPSIAGSKAVNLYVKTLAGRALPTLQLSRDDVPKIVELVASEKRFGEKEVDAIIRESAAVTIGKMNDSQQRQAAGLLRIAFSRAERDKNQEAMQWIAGASRFIRRSNVR